MNSIPFLEFDFSKVPNHLFDSELQIWEKKFIKWELDQTAISEEHLKNLAQARLISSQTLRKHHENQFWIHANSYVQTQIENDESIDWEHICRINQILTRSEELNLHRKKSVSICKNEFCPPELLRRKIEEFEHIFLKKQNLTLIDFFWIRLWILNIHPFDDANGRTSQLCADWLLMKLGYPPLSFQNKREAWIIIFQSQPTDNQLIFCFQLFLQTLENSFKILSEK